MKSARISLIVPLEARGARLDRFLSVALGSTERAPSRSELQRWIEQGRVTVDGAAKKASEKLREGVRVVVDPAPPELTTAVPESGIAFEVLHQDEDLIVVNKPAGLVMHPSAGHASGTLVNGLLALGAFAAGERGLFDEGDEEAHLRPGIVHRLDKGTSGVLVVARNARSREKLKAQFADHSIDREYVAITVGEASAATHDTLHGRHPIDRLRFSTKVREGKRAVTHVRVMDRFGVATFVACRLETGRTHQIRVHLAESGTPILGDPLYGKPPKHELLRVLAEQLGHQALHARLLGFEHPTRGERVSFMAEPPGDFAATLGALRRARNSPSAP